MHSHLLPGLDDGVQTLEDAIDLIGQFSRLGYKKLITTPHIMSDFYRNDKESITSRLEEVRNAMNSEGLSIQLDAAAEYYLDEALMEKVMNDQPLLCFGNKLVLFETNFLTEPFQLKEFIFNATTKGYKLVLAHPERYQYLIGDIEKAEDLRNRGVLFQINIPSIVGAYSRPIQKFAQQLINKGWVDFLGSDCHNQMQMDILKGAMKDKYFVKATNLALMNQSLITV
ncbi:MAG TPA: capsular biosynthesis protein [Cyclobacteriaceae bacterium]|nr:capsular biosynthesis protein [Cyclobacteriaceae bacterium]